MTAEPANSRFLLKLIFFFIFTIIWGYGVWKSHAGLNEKIKNKYTDSQFLSEHSKPDWMPESWLGPMAGAIKHSTKEFSFSNDLSKGLEELEKFGWIKHVGNVERDFNGHLKFDIELHKPVCVVSLGPKVDDGSYFLSEDVDYLRMVIKRDGRILNDEGQLINLPIVDVRTLWKSTQRRRKWVADIVAFLTEYNSHAICRNRLDLISIHPVSYREKYLMMKLKVYDRLDKKTKDIQWGEVAEFSVIENKSAEKKMSDFVAILESAKPFRSLDLSLSEAGAFNKRN